MTPLSPQEQEQLVATAWELIEEGELEDALDIAMQLTQHGVGEGYSIRASISEAEDNPEEALKLVQEGLSRFPQEWRLMLHQGELLGQAGEFDQALESFDRAAAQPGADQTWVVLNRASMLARMQQYDEALAALRSISDPEAITSAFAMELEILDHQEAYEEILRRAEEALDQLPDPDYEDDLEALGSIYYYVASAAWQLDQDPDLVEDYLRNAIEFNRTNMDLPGLLREMNPQFSDQSRLYSLLVSGELEQPGEEPIGFLTTYAVVADSPDEALEFVKAFEIEHIDRDSLQVIEYEEAENEENDPKGLYLVGELGFFNDEPETELPADED
ncbi:MAG: hypothetical protein NW241_07735 [Bacteroidia bacterium]|nr:hypothetical protein [Bacteroidia bacterium]